MKNRPRLLNLALVLAMLFGAVGFFPSPVEAAGIIRISQIYGGGGNSGATLTNDFIELFNAGDAPVDISGWSVQYASSTGTTWQVTELAGSIPAGGYYLVQEAQGSGGTTPLPTPDATGTIAMSSSNGKVALVDSTTALSGACPAGVVDFVGFGSANCYEGSGATPALSNTTAAIRNSGGCDDTDDNSVDFNTATPDPRNSVSPTNSCGPVSITEPVINEFSASTTGDDVEYIEIYGDPETDYSAYTMLEIEGDYFEAVTGTIDEVISLGTTDANGLYFVDPTGSLENGTITLLLVKDFTGTLGDDLDTDEDGTLDVTPWSAIVDAVAVYDGYDDGDESDLTYGTFLLGPNYDGLSSYAPGGASRIPDGFDTDADTDWVRNDFDLAGIPGFDGTPVVGEAYNTPGEPNMEVSAEAAEVLINEVDADTPSIDTAEFLELFDGGVGSTSLDGLALVFYNGSDDQSYQAFDLDGYSTDESGYFVVCGNSANVDNCDLDLEVSQDLIQNGADAIGLYLDDATNFPNDTPITTTNLLDAIVYDTDDSDDAALLVLLNAGQPQVDEDGQGDKDNHSNQRCPNGSGGLRNTDTYDQFSPTPGAENTCPVESTVLINEVDADTPGTDAAEFVELYDGGEGNTPLDGFVLVFYNGSDDQSYQAFDLDGYSTDESGYFVVCGNAANVANCDLDLEVTSDLIQNGADAIGLYLDDATNFPNDTPITTTNLLDAIVYDTDDSDDAALLVLLNAGQPQVDEDGQGDKDNHSNQRCPNGSGGLRNTDTYDQFSPTPGAENNCTLPLEVCGDSYTPIFEIQGDGTSTPLYDTVVSTEGIVIGDFQEGGKNGFFIQDKTGDGDPSTSDGVFVYAPSAMDFSVGDHVRVRGIATEYYDLTQVGSVSQVWLCEAGLDLPEPAEFVLPVADAMGFERYEGMYITIPQELVIAEYFNFDRYGEIVLSSERFMTFTAANEPDVDGFAASEEAYFLSTITLDDGLTSQNPDPAIHPDGDPFAMDNLFRGGDLVANVTGVMDYNYGLYKIQPTQGADYTSANPRPETLELEEGSLKVASFNVLNYFTTIDIGAYVCGPVEFVDVIGKIGEDPGDYWGTDPTTQNDTLIRKADVCSGDWESIDDFDPVYAWDSYGQDYFDDLGSHTTTCSSFNDLIISEYIEGSSNNKALEIYNGTGATVDLRDYKVVTYVNGDGDEPTNVLTWDLETLLENGDVYVIGNADASVESTILDKADILLSYPSVVHYNGDDVVALMKAGPDGMECRGADTDEELERQKAKILAALSDIDADVFGLMEIENDRIGPPSDYAVADLVTGLNDIVGAGTYDYIATGAIGTDAIKVALLYKPASVTPVGDYEILNSTVDARFIDTKNRPTLAQVFEDNLTGETFTVAVNHLKSKGSDCDDLSDPDLLDGAGNCNLTRLTAAQAMVDWLADETVFSQVDNVLIIGDLNSYDKEDPIDAIKAGSDDTLATEDDYFDMIYEILGEDAYGYVFDGKIGYLDYALASTALMDNILDVVLWHINADEPDIIDYDMSFKQDAQDALYAPDKYRSSDHDPVIVSLRMNEGPTAVGDTYETDQDVTLDVPAPGVMENDSDPNPNDALWVDVKTDPSHGQLTLNDDGSFTYIPDPGFFGVDTFEYYLLALPPEMRSDYMDIGLVTITVKPKYQFFVPLVVND